MIRPVVITQWLLKPGQPENADSKQIADLVDNYPYFVPGRLAESAQHLKSMGYGDKVMANLQLYGGNVILMHELMSNVVPDSIEPPVIEIPDLRAELFPAFNLEDEHADVDASEVDDIDLETIDVEDESFDVQAMVTDETELSTEPESIEQPPFDQSFTKDEIVEAAQTIPDVVIEVATIDAHDLKPDTVVVPKHAEAEISHSASTLAAEGMKLENEKEASTDDQFSEEDRASKESVFLPPRPNEPDVKVAESSSQKPYVKSSVQEDSMIQPIFTEDYFLYEGLQITDNLEPAPNPSVGKSLIVMMSFAEWLQYFKKKTESDVEEEEEQKALKTMWQKEKLAAAMEEQNEEIPEEVFEMAVNSITTQADVASEALAKILLNQGKTGKAIEMYKKLALLNPTKSTYFADLIKKIDKEDNR
jgi:hypothetical protein